MKWQWGQGDAHAWVGVTTGVACVQGDTLRQVEAGERSSPVGRLQTLKVGLTDRVSIRLPCRVLMGRGILGTARGRHASSSTW